MGNACYVAAFLCVNMSVSFVHNSNSNFGRCFTRSLLFIYFLHVGLHDFYITV